MMNKRLSKYARAWSKTLCAAMVLGLACACSDDYDLDDSRPGYLNTSIYDYLKEQKDQNGKPRYKNFVSLIDDLGYADVLAKTGSKTLFVADDDAFAAFYKDNEWGVGGYDELSLSQKNLLLNSAMVNNAYLLEMMSSTTGPNPGQCLRRETALTSTDSVPHFGPDELPTDYNPEDKDYWARFRTEAKGGIRMALDATTPMMTHFLATQMDNKNITDEDFRIIVGQERQKTDAFIYDSKVLEQDITCQNGYVNRLDRVLLTPQNLAEVLRTNGRTDIFSHMIDRFSAPFYNDELTTLYRNRYGTETDSVWEKRYFSIQENRKLQSDKGTDPKADAAGKEVNFGLTFDPGWNAYRASAQIEKEQDMGVIFAPTDEKLYDYFFGADGGGRFLLEAYAPEEMKAVSSLADKEKIYRAVDMIPRTTIQALLNNLMKEQFCISVPSKFETIKDDAQDPMLDASHLDKISDVLLANNGIIYLMDEVLTPAQYASVSAPAYVGRDMLVMNEAIQRLTWNGTAKNFYAYLLAMSSRFSLFTPRDGFWYIDPASFKGGQESLRAIYFDWNKDKKKVRGTSYKLNYDFASGTYTIDDSKALSTGSATDDELNDRLNDILETHTIVHSDHSATSGIDETQTGVECDQHFFIAKNGAPVYVKNATQRDHGMEVLGGWDYMHQREGARVTRFDDKTREKNGNGNGMAYQTDKAIVPTIESVYSEMYNNRAKYGRFFDLCQADNEDILKVLEPWLNRNELGDKIFTSNKEYINRYAVFVNEGGLPCYDNMTGEKVTDATNVRFFNNYRYTVYVPTDQAVDDAIAKGLPTWEAIREYLGIDEESGETTLDDRELQNRATRAAAMVTVLTNFLKYHFQDNSVFVDKPALAPTKYETATINSETGVYVKLTVQSAGGNTLSVTDADGQTMDVDANFRNVLVRDYIIATSGKQQKINASSFAVMHAVPKTLHYTQLPGGRFDGLCNTNAAARRTLKKFQIKK